MSSRGEVSVFTIVWVAMIVDVSNVMVMDLSAGSIPVFYDIYRYLNLVRYSKLDTFFVNLPKTYCLFSCSTESMMLMSSKLFHCIDTKILACSVCKVPQPLHRSFLHSHDVIFPRSLDDMFAYHQYVIEIACGCITRTVLATPHVCFAAGWLSVPGGLSNCSPKYQDSWQHHDTVNCDKLK